MPVTLAQAQQHSRSLYRRILRESRALAPDMREFYRRFARSSQGFGMHRSETDPTRIESFIKRTEQDMHWVRLKHHLE